MKMPFGKHKGKPLADVPSDYLRWLAGRELRQPLRGAVDAEIEARRASRQSQPPPSGDVQGIVEKLLQTGYRKLAFELHPDRGGDVREMQILNAVIEKLRQLVRQIAA